MIRYVFYFVLLSIAGRWKEKSNCQLKITYDKIRRVTSSWAESCSGGPLQSPVSLPRLGATEKDFGEIEFLHYELTPPAVELINNGHTLEVWSTIVCQEIICQFLAIPVEACSVEVWRGSSHQRRRSSGNIHLTQHSHSLGKRWEGLHSINSLTRIMWNVFCEGLNEGSEHRIETTSYGGEVNACSGCFSHHFMWH